MSHRLWSGLAACVILSALGCGRKPHHAAPETPVVRVVPVKVESISDYTFFTGRTAAVESVDVRARVTGYLTKINFKPGQDVTDGDGNPEKATVLFEIDPRPYQAALDQAKAQIDLAEARRKLAVADLDRGNELAKTPGAISKQDLDKYIAAQDEATASLKAAKANAETAELNMQFTKVRSPVKGRVGRNLLTLGNLVNQDVTLLTTIVSEDPMYGYFDVDEQTLLEVQERIRKKEIIKSKDGNTLVELGLATEGERYPHQGSIDFVNTQVDASTGTLQIRGSFPNPLPGPDLPRLLTPGLFVRIRLPLGKPHDALIVPQAAIARDQGKKFLLVVDDKGVVEYRPVVLGPEQPGGRQAVEPIKIVRSEKGVRAALPSEKGEDSLKAGDKVIVGGLQKVRPGMTVDAQPAEEARK